MDLDTYLKTAEISAADFAKKLGDEGVSPVLISQWRNKQRPVPAERCLEIERESGGAVTCEELRPDVDWGFLRGNRLADFKAQ